MDVTDAAINLLGRKSMKLVIEPLTQIEGALQCHFKFIMILVCEKNGPIFTSVIL